jgi:hypothetical protein
MQKRTFVRGATLVAALAATGIAFAQQAPF